MAEPKKSIWHISEIVELLGILFGVVATVINVLINGDFLNETVPYGRIIFVVGLFVMLLLMFTIILSEKKRGSSKVAALKDQLKTAFVRALDDSSLNPEKLSRDNHVQH